MALTTLLNVAPIRVPRPGPRGRGLLRLQ